jgi:hypothetical protein
MTVLAACSGKKAAPAEAPDAKSPSATTVIPMPVIQQVPTRPSTGRPRLHLTLRSTPAGASVTVDGRIAGVTPVRWEVEDDARQHEFVFTMNGFEPWRLKFSPSQDGVIHAALDPTPLPDAPP